MMLFAVEFSLEALGIVGTLGGLLVAALVKIHFLMLAAKDAHLNDVKSDRDTYKNLSKELVDNLEVIAKRDAEGKGKPIPVPVAPIVPEHNSPETPEQKDTAELQTLRARATAAALLLDLPARESGESPISTDEKIDANTKAIMDKLEEIPNAVVEAIDAKSDSPVPRGIAMCCTFKSISNRTIKFEDENGKGGTIIVANGAVVTLDGQPAKLTDLRDGDGVEFDGDPATHVAATRS